MTVEAPKRLAPTKSSLRRLFAHSGNRCAFDPCDHPLIDELGNFVGEICHIKAALPAGERFDPAMTNQERRAPDNLLLLCHRHHVVTDDVSRYDVSAMRALKAKHEARFASDARDLTDAQVEQAVEYFVDSDIADRTYETPYRVPVNCSRMNELLQWGEGEDHLRETAESITEYVSRLRRVPVDARAILGVVVDRGTASGYMNNSMSCLAHDVAQATVTSDDEIHRQAVLLEKWGVGRFYYDPDSGDYPEVIITGIDPGWNLWEAVKDFAEAAGMKVRDFAVDLRFDALDGD